MEPHCAFRVNRAVLIGSWLAFLVSALEWGEASSLEGVVGTSAERRESGLGGNRAGRPLAMRGDAF
eukprot:4677458-Pleurochrysis_carterae.AAC.3